MAGDTTIRIEVVDVPGGASSSTSTKPSNASASGQGGTQNDQGNGNGSYNPANNPSSYANNSPNADRAQRRPRRADEVPLEGRGWRHYVNKEQPYGSFAIDQMQWKQENRMGWVRDFMGLPDRLERAIVRAQSKALTAGDPNSFHELLKIQTQYRNEKFSSVLDQASGKIGEFAKFIFTPYRGIAHDTVNLGQNVKTVTTYVAGFAAVFPPLALAIKAFGTVIGTAAEVVGYAQGKLTEEANRVRAFSPELRMQGVMAGIRELRTDMQIAREFGAQMARQEEQGSRREAAWRLVSTKVAAVIAGPFEQMNEAWTSTLEALAGQRPFMDAAVNAMAAIPGMANAVVNEAKARNEQFKEKQGDLDIENSKELCQQVLNVILPGEERIPAARFLQPPKQNRVRKAENNVMFGGGDLPGVNLR